MMNECFISENKMYFEDVYGYFVGEGELVTLAQLRNFYNNFKGIDPVVDSYNNFNDWFLDSLENGYIAE